MKVVKNLVTIEMSESFDNKAIINKLIEKLSNGDRTVSGSDIAFILMNTCLHHGVS
jgi:hypothetical protein